MVDPITAYRTPWVIKALHSPYLTPWMIKAIFPSSTTIMAANPTTDGRSSFRSHERELEKYNKVAIKMMLRMITRNWNSNMGIAPRVFFILGMCEGVTPAGQGLEETPAPSLTADPFISRHYTRVLFSQF